MASGCDKLYTGGTQMKLKNKKTGEIVDIDLKSIKYPNTPQGIPEYKLHHSLAELNEEWEDYEEPNKYYWFINPEGEVVSICEEDDSPEGIKASKEIGNYFETEEEAEKAVKKLKAWKRLKDKGFKFSKDWVYRYDQPFVKNHTYFEFVAICEDGALFDDLDLLFGGEE